MRSKRTFFMNGIFLLCLGYLIYQISLSYRHEKATDELVIQKEVMGITQIVDMQKEIAIQQKIDEAIWKAEQKWRRSQKEAEEIEIEEKVPDLLPEFKPLYEKNQDLIGWISIEGTKINNPVLQCDDDEFYVTNNFEKETDKYGSLFIKAFADIGKPDTNVIIYGHNMRDGSMFGELDNYRSKDYYATHKIIKFDTLYERHEYEIVSIFLSKVYRKEEAVFKYYQFSQAQNEEEFQQFYDAIKGEALYDTKVSAEYGDTFITLSTCAYHEENGRLVVVAKRLKDKLPEDN